MTLVSEELASMIDLAIDAARATGGLVTPAAGGALLAAGYDRDFATMTVDGAAVEPARVPSLDSISLRGRMLRGAETQHHLIDPATGRSARTPWRDVTVAAQNCVAADVAAKAALLLGRAGPSWLDRRGLAGRFVAADGAVHVNESWRQATVEPAIRAA